MSMVCVVILSLFFYRTAMLLTHSFFFTPHMYFSILLAKIDGESNQLPDFDNDMNPSRLMI